MRRDASDRVTELFTTSSRELTPASARPAACVLYAPVSADSEVSQHCAAVLSDAELSRASRFARDADRDLFLQRRAFRRFCAASALGVSRPLSQVLFKETENGRPYLPGWPELCFSFSSCRLGLLGAWSATHGVGVDVEDPTRSLETVELAHRYFTEAEAAAVEGASGPERQRTLFCRFWSLKEAALKSIGEGLPFGLDSFGFELAPQVRVVRAPSDHGGPERFSAHVLEGVDGCGALVLSQR